jgi:hypothetical protein
MLQAFREIASLPDFDELLNQTLDRVAAIESLGRTRELVAKDLVLKGKYRINQGRDSITVKLEEPDDVDDGDDDNPYALDVADYKYWWRRRSSSTQEPSTEADLVQKGSGATNFKQ